MIAENEWKIPSQEIKFIPVLAEIFPAATDWTSSGNIEGAFLYQINPLKSEGSAELHLTDAAFASEKEKIAMEGIQFDLELPNLPQLETRANQHFSAEKIVFQEDSVEDLKVKYRMESPEIWYVENLKF